MVRTLRREGYDPRPHNRQQDLALQKVEYGADSARINARTRAMNQNAQTRYQMDLAAHNRAMREKNRPPQSMVARLSSGLRRAFA